MVLRAFRNWGCFIAFLAALSPVSMASPNLEDLNDYAFVASRQSNDVAVIAVLDDEVVAKISLDAIPGQIVVSEKARQLIATHVEEQKVSIVDLDAGKVATTIDLGFSPDILKLEDNLGVIALGLTGSGKVRLISLDEMSVLASIDDLDPISDLMFGRDGQHLLVAQRNAGKIDLVDVHQGVLVDQIILKDADIGIRNLIRTPGGKTGLALHGESGVLSALNLDDKVQVGASRLPGPVFEGFPSANSQYFLMPNGDAGTMSMVSSWTYQESERLLAPSSPTGVNFAMFDTIAFAFSHASRNAMAISLIEDDTPKPTMIPLPGTPETGLTVDAGKKIYVALSDTNQVAVIDASKQELVGLIDDVGSEPWAITAAGGLGYCH
ncbi:MAG: YncE family protein [Geminicoccaceae bacterium]